MEKELPFFIGGKVGSKLIKDLTLEDKQIILLNFLKSSGALIQPVVTHDFQEWVLNHSMISVEDFKVCFEALEEKEFIKTISNAKQASVFATFITSKGVLEIEKYDKTIRNEEMIELDLIHKKRTHKYFYWLLGFTTVAFIISAYNFIKAL